MYIHRERDQLIVFVLRFVRPAAQRSGAADRSARGAAGAAPGAVPPFATAAEEGGRNVKQVGHAYATRWLRSLSVGNRTRTANTEKRWNQPLNYQQIPDTWVTRRFGLGPCETRSASLTAELPHGNNLN